MPSILSNLQMFCGIHWKAWQLSFDKHSPAHSTLVLRYLFDYLGWNIKVKKDLISSLVIFYLSLELYSYNISKWLLTYVLKFCRFKIRCQGMFSRIHSFELLHFNGSDFNICISTVSLNGIFNFLWAMFMVFIHSQWWYC